MGIEYNEKATERMRDYVGNHKEELVRRTDRDPVMRLCDLLRMGYHKRFCQRKERGRPGHHRFDRRLRSERGRAL